ncbi:helix-turn-helix transcriptional regulator [Bacillus velezensis]|uniref:helix-turn-helix domain-containing protein n=1 Tax=Bacillus velezensis TaxID=492670 RepID=UPI002FCD3819
MLTETSLYQIRKVYRLSQYDVAKITGVSVPMVSMIESGQRRLPEKVANRFTEALQLTPEKIIKLVQFYEETEVPR